MKKLFDFFGGRKNFNFLVYIGIFLVNVWLIAGRPLNEVELGVLGGFLLGGAGLNVAQKFRNNGNEKDKTV